MANVVKLSSQDRKELDKFTKFFAIKIVQVIVQARLGEKLKTKSKPFSSGVDWFSVTIDDVPEVLAETRKALSGHLPTIGISLCIEISLKTVEGDTMVLETWCLGMTEQCDVDARISYTVYNRMAVLLKSLLVVSRVTPAYRLSCRQGPDSYVICYRVYLGEPQYYMLGEGFQEVHVGQVGTPVGTFFLTVTYRTKLTITPQRIERDCPFMVKSDHFKPDLSPRGPKKWPRVDLGSVIDDLAAACDECQELACTPLALNSPNEINGIHHHQQHHLTFVDKKSPRGEKDIEAKVFCGNECQNEIKKIGAFIGELRNVDPIAGSEFLMPEMAFSSLLQHDQDNNIVHKKTAVNLKINSNNNNINNNYNNNTEVIVNGTAHNEKMDVRSENGSHDSQKSSSSITSAAMDDFVMVELKTPFASPDPSSDLSAFYRECQSAPPLDSFKNHPTLAEQVNDISNQLAMFEVNMHDFDELVDSLCNSEVWK